MTKLRNVNGTSLQVAVVAVLCIGWFVSFGTVRADDSGPLRTEEREDCDNYDALRQPFFGDLHIHTSYSYDSYVSSQRNDPRAAYRFAKGEPMTLPADDGSQTVVAQLRRPLDFATVTDHAEYLGEMNICTKDPTNPGYWYPLCVITRSNDFWTQLYAAQQWSLLGGFGTDPVRSPLCDIPGVNCGSKLSEFWQNIQDAAEEAYDRSSTCGFTSFVAYEYTNGPGGKNLHRNVIYRNERVSPLPTSAYETGTGPAAVPELWSHLQEDCLDAGNGCDVLAIPHNPNLSGGLMFRDPASVEEAEQRASFEPLVEITQHKASSECRYDRLEGAGLDTEDELCTFEQNETDNLNTLAVVNGINMAPQVNKHIPLDQFGRRNMVRNVLKDGLVLGQEMGVNPFKLGFVGGTDTHNATSGAVEEDDFVGHVGRRDTEHRNVQDHFVDNPGGLAVVWAEENSRDAIFEALRRKETYATSGTRPIVRFFGGYDFPGDLCGNPQLVSQGYEKGVPMGSDLKGKRPNFGGKPSFVVTALKDVGSPGHPGTDLQRIQIVKGWVDSEGSSHEAVYDVAGNPDNGASVDQDTCEPVGSGYVDLCTVWQDESFDPTQDAFYYARVLENPTCRWSTRQCIAAGVNPFASTCESDAAVANAVAQAGGAVGDVYGKCCTAEEDSRFYSPVIQERAWTSPIWYQAASK